ncbi:MAG: GWxTD domain-containing protein, partial [Bacteroidetes bacterium]|nr:GWxTD domain-containing protein [Bacteroidota bacterium]
MCIRDSECTVQFIFNSVSIVRTLLFDVVWFNKPRSLSDSRLALEVLRYIAPDSVVDAIGSLSTPSGIRRFKNFWDQFNPDTTKAYNPVMAEFYRRVDDAILRFSTEDSNNGYKSDRGKVFILNGSPSKIDRRFKPGSDPIEIWTYERLRKRYIFIDSQRNGNYSFVQEEEF